MNRTSCLLLAAAAALLGCASTPKEDTSARNRAIVLEVFDALESGDVDVLQRYFDPEGDVIVGLNVRKYGGPYQTFREAAPFPSALSDVTVDVERIFAAGDQVAIQSMICGNQAYTLLGIEPAGRRVCSRYTNLYVLRNGRIVSNTVGVYRDQIREQLEADE
ncbi:MAG: ester cyclase [Pseudomonadota bacterium]